MASSTHDTLATLDRPTHSGACQACDMLESAERRYLDHMLVASARAQSQAEMIADALGFCGRHGALIAAGEVHSAAIARILRAAIDLTLERLGTGMIGGEVTRDILFQSADACPACSYCVTRLTRGLARAVGPQKHGVAAHARLGGLCVSHYHDAINLSGPRRLLPLAKAQLARVKTTNGSFARGELAMPDSSALDVLAGNRGLSPAVPSGYDLSKARNDGGASLEAEEACPICTGMARDLHRRIDFAQWGLRMGADAWMVLPTCSEHLRLFERLAGKQAAEHAARHGATAIAAMLKNGIGAVTRARRQREAEAQLPGYKPKSPATILRLEREALTPGPWCPICNGLAAAREREIGHVLEQMKRGQTTRGIERGYGLCMKHFASVFLFAPKGAMRAAMAQAQREKLTALQRDLSESPDTSSGLRSGVPAWKGAIYRLSGWM